MLLLQVNDQMKRFLELHNQHFPAVQVHGDCIHYDELRGMCRRMRRIDSTWWPSKAMGPAPRLALRGKPQGRALDPGLLAAYIKVQEEQYRRIVDPIIKSGGSDAGMAQDLDFGDARGLLGAVLAILCAPVSVFVVLSCTGVSLLYKLLSSLVVAFMVAVAESYFIAKRLAHGQ